MSARDRLSPAQAARRMGVHRNTVYAWCQKSLEGEETPLARVDRNPHTGYLSVKIDDASSGNKKQK